MNATLPTSSSPSPAELSALAEETRERFLTGQGFTLTEDGESFPVRVLDSNRAATGQQPGASSPSAPPAATASSPAG